MEELSKQVIRFSRRGSLFELRCLLEDNVNVNYKDEDGMTGLLWACMREHVQCAQLLLEHKTDVHLADQSGTSALMYAACTENVEAVKLLLECNADVNHANEFGYAPLLYVSWFGAFDSLKLILEHHADVRHKTSDGKTVLSKHGRLSEETGSKNLREFLLLCCGAEGVETTDMESWAEMKTRITAYHTELKKVLSDKVIVDTRLYVEEPGLYHEPLERVMEYCGFNLMLENDPNGNEDDPIPMLLRDRQERVSSALYWWNLLHV